MMQALSAAISISCGLGAEFCPSSSWGSSTSISKWRRTSWPPIVYDSTVERLLVCPRHAVETRKATMPFLWSRSISRTTEPSASRSRPFTLLPVFVIVAIVVLLVVVVVEVSAERFGDLCHALGRSRVQIGERADELRMRHPRPEVGPPLPRHLGSHEGLSLGGAETASGGPGEVVHVELHLLGESPVQHAADLEVLAHRSVDGRSVEGAAEALPHQRVELRVLRLLHPVMLEQALELGIEILVVPHALDPVPLRHPLDVQDGQGHRERRVAEHGLGHGVGRADHLAGGAEAALEFRAEAAEEVDVL